jgi:hypothetical protein
MAVKWQCCTATPSTLHNFHPVPPTLTQQRWHWLAVGHAAGGAGAPVCWGVQLSVRVMLVDPPVDR